MHWDYIQRALLRRNADGTVSKIKICCCWTSSADTTLAVAVVIHGRLCAFAMQLNCSDPALLFVLVMG